MLPFHLTFDPAARGIGVVDEGRGFARWVRDEAAAVRRARRVRRRRLRRRAGRDAAAGPQRGVDRGGGAVRRLAARRARLRARRAARRRCWSSRSSGSGRSGRRPPQRLVWLLAAGGVACVLGPELLYVRDEFDGSALYRMNTVFKLGYQAWLLLGLAGIGALAWWRRVAAAPRRALGLRGARGRGGRRRRGLPGGRHVRAQGRLRPRADARRPRLAARPGARRRRRDRVAQRPRAGGRGRARGGRPGLLRLRPRADLDVHRPAVRAGLGGPRAPVGPCGRRPGGGDRRRRSRSPTTAAAQAVLERHGVRYVVVGPLERTDYGDAGVAKWDQLGERVFDADGTTVWEIAPPPRRPGARRATPACRPSGSTARAR